MAKLAIHLVIIALVLFLANASITTVMVDSEENPWGRPEGSCQEQIMKQNYLQHCQRYVEEKFSGSSHNPSRHLDSCCEQLENLDKQCRCPGLKQAMQKQMQGEIGREEMREMHQVAEKIISKCNMEPRKCEMQPRTTITLNNARGRKEGSCQQQIQKQNYLRHCQKYMEEQCSSRSRENTSEKHLDSCCEQLENLDRQCRCPGLKQAMQQQMQGGVMGREEMRQMYQVAEKIMSKCEIEPGRCDMQPRNWI
ncbi:hypothetical protein DITRI_Ditri14bG0129200 [Diplodiscus trichospermus]